VPAACSKKDDKGGGAAGDPCETAINQAVDKMLAKGNQDARAPTPMLEIANKLRANHDRALQGRFVVGVRARVLPRRD